jgi:hypothetical protein
MIIKIFICMLLLKFLLFQKFNLDEIEESYILLDDDNFDDTIK